MKHLLWAIPCLLVLAMARPAQAQLALTPTAIADGFSLTTFATGFPEDSDEANGAAGPLGIGFLNGGVLVADAPGNVRLFPSDTDGQIIADAPSLQNYGHNNALGIAQLDGDTYLTQQVDGTVVQIDGTGTVVRTVASVPNATGIVADTATGHLFVSTYGGDIYNVDPVAGTAQVFISDAQTADGLTLSPDDSILYTAAVSDGGGHILGYSTATGAQVFDSGSVPDVDGTAIGYGAFAGNIFGNTNLGDVVEVNLATDAQTLIADGGTRGDFVAVDPSNDTLLLTQSDRVMRLAGPNGSGFGPTPSTAVPELSPFALLALGLLPLGLAAIRRARRPA